MPDLDFRYFAVVRALEGDLLLGEPLLFPEIVVLGGDRAELAGALEARVRKAVEALDAEDVYRRRAAGAPRAAEVDVELAPSRDAIGWREPVVLTFHYVRWEHGGEAHLAFVPVLGIVTVASSAGQLERKLPRDIRAAMYRRGVTGSLRDLVELQRARRVDVVESQLVAELRSAREKSRARRQERPGSDERESVLKGVATDLVADGSSPGAFGVSKPVAQLAAALSGDRRPSVLLVGPSGVGKTAVVHELVCGRRGYGLGRTRFWSTTGARIVAGASGYGMWQERCEKMVRALSGAGGVLHVESLVELMGVGKSEYNEQGVAGFLRPHIERGDLQVITECVPEQLSVIEREEPEMLAALRRIDVAPPGDVAAREILGWAAGPRRHTGRRDSVTEGAIETIDRLHRRFAAYSGLPGRPLRFLQDLLADRADEVVTGKEVVAAFARETGLPRFLLDGDEPLRLDETRDFFSRRVMGQPRAVDRVVDVLATVKAGLSPPGRPISSMLFIGPTGVGKTEMVKALAEFVYRSPARMIRIDMSEYVDAPSIDRLIGGSLWREGLLTAKIREQPFSVVLLDEFEKAHASFFDLLLQILGDGRLTDGAGRVADFSNAIVLMTSNLGVESFGRASPGFRPVDDRLQQAERHFTARVREFVRPELFNRLDRIVPFSPLDPATIRAIARRELDKVRSRDGIRHRRLAIDVDPAVVDFLADRGYEPQYGARPLQRAIVGRLVTRLADCVNRYDVDLPLSVRVDLVDGAVAVRARREAERGPTRGDASDHERQALASAVAKARRRIQLLAVSGLMQDVRTQLHLLEEELLKLEQQDRSATSRGETAVGPRAKRLRAQSRGETAVGPRAKRLRAKRLEERIREVEGLMARAVRLEDDTLRAFYADRPLDAQAVRAALRAVEDERERVALEALLESDPPPEQITLVLSGEDPRCIASLAGAYRHVVLRREGTVAVFELHRHPPPPAAVALSMYRRKPPNDRAEIAYARPVHEGGRFLASPPAELRVLAVSVTGRLFSLLFGDESGRHVFRAKGAVDRDCRVDIVNGNVGAFRPPHDFGRRAATRGLEMRRVYDPGRGTIDAILSAALDRRLSERLGLEEW